MFTSSLGHVDLYHHTILLITTSMLMHIREKRLELVALDTSTSTECSSFQQRPYVEDKFALKIDVLDDCMHEGAGIWTSIHRNVLEGANIITRKKSRDTMSNTCTSILVET